MAGLIEKDDPNDSRAFVLEDASVQGVSPLGWAEAVAQAAHRWQADRVVAEVNQGGAMVETVLHQVDPLLPVKQVHASRGKSARAEPVAALYEQGRVSHGQGLEKLEAQMCLMSAQGYEGSGSPDRVDALVWALTELMLSTRKPLQAPRFRVLG